MLRLLTLVFINQFRTLIDIALISKPNWLDLSLSYKSQNTKI